MVDNLTKKQRSYCMSRIRGSGTKPERILISKLKGFIYQPKIFGRPDFVNYLTRKVIFIDGCFWHKCPKHFIAPKSNRRYWMVKIEKNVLRDAEVTLSYKMTGWKVKRIWEHSFES